MQRSHGVTAALLGSMILAVCCAGCAQRTSGASLRPGLPPPSLTPPGVVLDHSPAASGRYIGSPGIAVLSSGEYLAKDDVFGPNKPKPRLTRIFASKDRGLTWAHRSDVYDVAWASLFVHRDAVYMMGTNKPYGKAVILKSVDAGATWTDPVDSKSGLLFKRGSFHCAPVPVLEHKGRLWRAMEDASGPGGWGYRFLAFMMSAPVDADLLDADSWTSSNAIGHSSEWLGGQFGGWLEGNAVAAPDGHIVNILRVSRTPEGETAAIIRISEDGKTATFDPEHGFIPFPGGSVKFTIRHDPKTNRYWALSNAMLPQHKFIVPSRVRNALALASSADLRQWDINCVLLYHPDRARHGFQYVDWLFDGDDIIAVSRTAYDDAEGGAHNQHDANYLTFHRFPNFRSLSMQDSVVAPQAPVKKRKIR